jgi:hypothetical protein
VSEFKLKLSEQTGYRLYNQIGKELPSPRTTVQGLINFASKIYGKKIYAKIVDVNEIILFETLADVTKQEVNRDNIVFYIRGEHKSCCD